MKEGSRSWRMPESCIHPAPNDLGESMLHDIGLTEAFDSHRLPLEEAGGRLA
jgi:hypothetical protein